MLNFEARKQQGKLGKNCNFGLVFNLKIVEED